MIYAVKYNVDNVEPFGTFETEEEFKAKIQELSEPKEVEQCSEMVYKSVVWALQYLENVGREFFKEIKRSSFRYDSF